MTADDIISAARECIGTPFQHQGRINGLALDCAGVIVCVASKFGLKSIQPAGYGRSPCNGMLEEAADMQPYLDRVTAMQAGDVLMMRFTGEPQHVGIYTGENIIHAYESVGKVVEHRLDEKWAARIVRIYRFKDIA
ncbi:MAG: NlpC/P60 family protein [Sulfuriferula sp.]